MRYLIVTLFMLGVAAAPAQAHPGHLAGLAGHDHWVAGAAIGAAIAVGVWGALKGRRKTGGEARPGAEGKGDDTREPQEG
jgi:hydrogenase/urease accessory protein HupE